MFGTLYIIMITDDPLSQSHTVCQAFPIICVCHIYYKKLTVLGQKYIFSKICVSDHLFRHFAKLLRFWYDDCLIEHKHMTPTELTNRIIV